MLIYQGYIEIVFEFHGGIHTGSPSKKKITQSLSENECKSLTLTDECFTAHTEAQHLAKSE